MDCSIINENEKLKVHYLLISQEKLKRNSFYDETRI